LLKSELIGNLRRPRSFICLVLFVGACMVAMIPTLIWWETGGAPMGQISSLVFNSLCAVMAVGGTLLLPGLAAISITSERDQDTYDLLRLTLIGPGGLVLGKLIGVVGLYLLLCVAALPLMGVVFFLVGLDWVEVLRNFGLILLNAVACASAGLMCGAGFRRAVVAVLAAYLCTFGLYFIGGRILISGTSGLPSGSYIFVLAYTFGGIAAFFLSMLSVAILQRPTGVQGAPPNKVIDDPAILEARRKKFPYYLIDPLRRKEAIGDHQNPMLVKELRWGAITRATVAVRVFYLSVFGYAALGISFAWPAWPGWAYDVNRLCQSVANSLVVQTGLTVLLCPALAATAFTKEREMGHVDMLRMTLLAPRQILAGKLAAGLLAIAPLVLGATFAGLPILAMTGLDRSLWTLVAGYPTLYVNVWVAICLSLYASLLTRRSSTAMVLSYLFSIVLLAGIPQYAVMVVLGFLRRDYGDPSISILPMALLTPTWAYTQMSYQWYTPWGLFSWLLSLVSYGLFGWALIALSAQRLKRRFMRD
jgi:ABC-type transport system involved in multi-copper enzyme maturation permease subunit